MKYIEVEVLNPGIVHQAEDMAVCAARLTQGGHKIKRMADMIDLYNKPYSKKLLAGLTELPHPTLQKFAVINVAVVGASRRFLAQITRHQNEVKFMSASLQYSDYSHEGSFAVPYSCLAAGEDAVGEYLEHCVADLDFYEDAINGGLDHDAAGYAMPQSLRNVLIISATPYQWKHMIAQRVCRRNTDETRIVMLKIWEKLIELSPELFSPFTTGPDCLVKGCQEGKMTCGHSIRRDCEHWTPTEILKTDYPLLFEGGM